MEMIEKYGIEDYNLPKVAAAILSIHRIPHPKAEDYEGDESKQIKNWNAFFAKLFSSEAFKNFNTKYKFKRPNHDEYTSSWPQTTYLVCDEPAIGFQSSFTEHDMLSSSVKDLVENISSGMYAYRFTDSSKIGSGGEVYSTKGEPFDFAENSAHLYKEATEKAAYSWKKEKRSVRTGEVLQNEGWYRMYTKSEKGFKVRKFTTSKYAIVTERPDYVMCYEDFVNLDKKAFVNDFLAVVDEVLNDIDNANAQRDHDTELCKGLFKSLWTSGYGDLVKVLGSEERCKEYNAAKSKDTSNMSAAFTMARAGMAPRGWVPSAFKEAHANDYTADEWRRIELYSSNNGYDDDFNFNKNNIYINKR